MSQTKPSRTRHDQVQLGMSKSCASIAPKDLHNPFGSLTLTFWEYVETRFGVYIRKALLEWWLSEWDMVCSLRSWHFSFLERRRKPQLRENYRAAIQWFINSFQCTWSPDSLSMYEDHNYSELSEKMIYVFCFAPDMLDCDLSDDLKIKSPL